MKKKTGFLILLITAVVLLFFVSFNAQEGETCSETKIDFDEDFTAVTYKDEVKSSVDHWGDGFIQLGFAGIIQQMPSAANLPTWINMMAPADFDGDGLTDIVATSDVRSKTITFIKNMGGAVYQEMSPPYIYTQSWNTRLNALIAGDFNADGAPDFMYVLSTTHAGDRVRALDEVWMFEHQGFGAIPGDGVPKFNRYDYTSRIGGALEGIGWSTTHQVIDFDNDGDLDILFANGFGKVLLLRNSGNRPLSNNRKFRVETLIDAKVGESGNRWNERGVVAVQAQDFNGDGYVDIIIGAVNWRGLKYYINDGTGNFAYQQTIGDLTGSDLHDDEYDGACTALAAADFDNDGDMDLMVGTDNWNVQEAFPPVYNIGSRQWNSGCGVNYYTGTEHGGKAFFLRNDGSGNFNSHLMYDGPALIQDGVCAAWDFDFGLALDYDGDGDVDGLIADGNHSEFYYYFENFVSDRFNLMGIAQSANITEDSYPGGLDPTAHAITKVQITAIDQNVQGSSDGLKITYYVSNNGGLSWEFYAEFAESDISNSSGLPEHTFSTFGTDLRWKAVMEAPDDYPDPDSEYHGTSNDSPRINHISLAYTFVDRREYSRTSVATSITGEDDTKIQLIIGGTFYFPGWQGHLRAYDVTDLTPLPTSYTELRTITTAQEEDAIEEGYTWIAAHERTVQEEVLIMWDAGQILDTRNANDRTIYTAIPDGAGGFTRLAFTDANEPLMVDELGDSYLADVENNEVGLINFVRGENRDWKLGDINHSNPAIVEAPNGSPAQMGSGYDLFVEDWKDRPKSLIVGANDGMLHCFDVANGDELWAFIPFSLLPTLTNMWAVDPESGERYFSRQASVDGSPTVADVYFNNDWHTIVICGLGPGKGSTVGGGITGNFYFALDITNIEDPQPLWEFTDDTMGATWSVPEIVKINKDGEETWVAFMGSGYDNVPGQGVQGDTFYGVTVDNGQKFFDFDVSEVDTSAVWSNARNVEAAIPASPGVLDMDGDGYNDRVYIPDLEGRVWKVDTSFEFLAGDPWNPELIFEDSNNYPVITKPATWIDPGTEGAFPRIFFGTGGDDAAPDDTTYSFAGMIDAAAPEIEWFVGDPAIFNQATGEHAGDLSPGEKVWADPKVANYIVYFSVLTGNIESVDPCQNLSGIGKLFGRYIHSASGGAVGGSAFTQASGTVEALNLQIKTRSAVTIAEIETAGGKKKREVYIQEYNSTIQKLEQPIGAFLRIKSWREIYKIIKQ